MLRLRGVSVPPMRGRDAGFVAGAPSLRNPTVVEAVAEIAHEPITLADDLGTPECLEAAHRASSSFEMLMVTLNPLLLHLAPDVHGFSRDCCKRGRIARRFVSRC